MEVIALQCPNCGAGVDSSQKKCNSCRQPIMLSSFRSAVEMPLPQILLKRVHHHRRHLEGESFHIRLFILF